MMTASEIKTEIARLEAANAEASGWGSAVGARLERLKYLNSELHRTGVSLSALRKYPLIYVGTPYTKYAGGIDAAFTDACKLTARLMQQGLKVYSPIAHTHPLAIHGGLDPLDLSIWLPFDGAMIDKSDALVVAMMPGWETSTGVRHEIHAFLESSKPVFFLNPDDLSLHQAAA